MLSASNVARAPCSVSEDTITTGTGRSVMITESAVSPSISGMLMSSVTTWGWKARFSAMASLPLRAWRISNPPAASNNNDNCRRMSAESSTISNLIIASGRFAQTGRVQQAGWIKQLQHPPVSRQIGDFRQQRALASG